jgi:hypothetical protein
MSTLKIIEKTQLEQLFGMASGYVLDFSNRTFQNFIRENSGVDIYAEKYVLNGDSKANRLRAFWQQEPDNVVGKVLADLIEYWIYKNPQPNAAHGALVGNCSRIVERLLGKQVSPGDSEKRFLNKDLGAASLRKATVDAALLPILESRFAEATRCLTNDAPLAAIFLCGSVLEGLLLGVARAKPKQFNEATNSPKDAAGKVKQFQNWRLAELIDVACEVGCLTLDVKKFSHALRDFRNYIHPYQQWISRFNPDKHTAGICLQVLKAAIACLSGERGCGQGGKDDSGLH